MSRGWSGGSTRAWRILREAVSVRLCRDPALVSSWIWRLRTRRRDLFLWREGWKIKAEVAAR